MNVNGEEINEFIKTLLINQIKNKNEMNNQTDIICDGVR